MHEKFGKSFRDIESLKTSFFEDNDKHLARALSFAEVYVQQPRRTRCKVCDGFLPTAPDFQKHLVPYAACHTCAHLNGLHEDTEEYCESVYTSNAGAEYAAAYSVSDVEAFHKRREAIYDPKAAFLFESLRREGEAPEELTYADMGAGSGYFVSALRNLKARRVFGYEVGEAQVALSRWVMPDAPITLTALSGIVSVTASVDADVVSFIGVFEHLQNLRGTLRALRSNSRVRYLYFCVPMFGVTVFNEMAFPEVMPRHLAVGHTHLFTRESIAYFTREYEFNPVSAWWFGTDVMDYYRSVYVSLRKESTPATRELASKWVDLYGPLVDPIQLAIDQRRESSQVHMLMRIR